MTHTVGVLLLAAGAALIVLDLVVTSSTDHRSTLIRLRLQRRFPRLSQGLLVVLVCTAGAAVFTVGLDLLSRT
jgi:hypothetical protein